MLPYILVIAAVILIPVLAAFAGDEPDNTTVHDQLDEPRDDDEPELMAAAA